MPLPPVQPPRRRGGNGRLGHGQAALLEEGASSGIAAKDGRQREARCPPPGSAPSSAGAPRRLHARFRRIRPGPGALRSADLRYRPEGEDRRPEPDGPDPGNACPRGRSQDGGSPGASAAIRRAEEGAYPGPPARPNPCPGIARGGRDPCPTRRPCPAAGAGQGTREGYAETETGYIPGKGRPHQRLHLCRDTIELLAQAAVRASHRHS